jgi:hypothetical protein
MMMQKSVIPSELVLGPVIQSICSGKISEKDLIPFIRFCVRLSIGYLRYKSSIGYKISESGTGSQNYEDIAYDVLADLFERNTSGQFIRIQSYFLPYLHENLPEPEWMIILRRLVVSRTQQGLFHLFRNRDPQGAKLYRCVKLAVFRSTDYEWTEYLGREWIRRRPAGKSVKAERMQPEEWNMLKPELYALFSPQDGTPLMVQKIMEIAASHHQEDCWIALDELFYLIRGYRNLLSETNGTNTERGADIPDILFRNDVEQVLDTIYSDLCKRADSTYLKKNKLDPVMVQGFKDALRSMITDLNDGHPLNTCFYYIKENMPGISEQVYKEKLRTQFEYMVKLLKNQISEKLFFSGR